MALGCRGPFGKFKIVEVLRKLFKLVVQMAVFLPSWALVIPRSEKGA